MCRFLMLTLACVVSEQAQRVQTCTDHHLGIYAIDVAFGSGLDDVWFFKALWSL